MHCLLDNRTRVKELCHPKINIDNISKVYICTYKSLVYYLSTCPYIIFLVQKLLFFILIHSLKLGFQLCYVTFTAYQNKGITGGREERERERTNYKHHMISSFIMPLHAAYVAMTALHKSHR